MQTMFTKAIKKIIEGVQRCDDNSGRDLLSHMLHNMTLSRIGVTLIRRYQFSFELDNFV